MIFAEREMTFFFTIYISNFCVCSFHILRNFSARAVFTRFTSCWYKKIFISTDLEISTLEIDIASDEAHCTVYM
jgi:hypothetical protein